MFLSLIFSFQNHREYYKNCTTSCQNTLPTRSTLLWRSFPCHCHAVFSPLAQSCPIPGMDILAAPTGHSSQPGTNKKPRDSQESRDLLYRQCVIDYLFRAVATSTAQATVQPTMGLLPIPRKPIISTWAGTDEEPAN